MHAGMPDSPFPSPPPGTRQTPPPDQADPPGPGRPPGQTPPGPGRHPSGLGRHPLDQADPPGPGRHPLGSRLQHTVYERPVRILLECILVMLCISSVLFYHYSYFQQKVKAQNYQGIINIFQPRPLVCKSTYSLLDQTL